MDPMARTDFSVYTILLLFDSCLPELTTMAPKIMPEMKYEVEVHNQNLGDKRDHAIVQLEDPEKVAKII